jgi:16S rRNA C1402 (ribose-2'-O) methylase RsmI
MPRLHRFDQHSRNVDRWLNQIRLGKTLCLVSDAGTPCISDPGALLLQQASLN